jgi:hypothetical protein
MGVDKILILNISAPSNCDMQKPYCAYFSCAMVPLKMIETITVFRDDYQLPGTVLYFITTVACK